jgi:lipopolysaccharide cholinephosphotransferase licD
LEYGAFVDIFAVNGMPDNVAEIKKMKKDIFLCSRFLHMYISSIYRIRGKRKKFTWFFKPFAKWALNKSNEIFNRYDFDSSKYAMNFEGDSIEKELMESDLFNHLIDVEFEGHQFKVFEQYDSYLKHMYGDYMQLPSIEEQEPHHSFDLYKI